MNIHIHCYLFDICNFVKILTSNVYTKILCRCTFNIFMRIKEQRMCECMIFFIYNLFNQVTIFLLRFIEKIQKRQNRKFQLTTNIAKKSSNILYKCISCT